MRARGSELERERESGQGRGGGDAPALDRTTGAAPVHTLTDGRNHEYDAGRRAADSAYRMALEQRLHFHCANVARLPPATRLLHDYALLRMLEEARDRSASRRSGPDEGPAVSVTATTPSVASSGAASGDGSAWPAPAAPEADVAAETAAAGVTAPSPVEVEAELPSYGIGRLPYSDPWLDDTPTPTPSDNGTAGGAAAPSGAATLTRGDDNRPRKPRTLAGMLYSSAASYFGVPVAADERPATPKIEFQPKPMVVDEDEGADAESLLDVRTTASEAADNEAALSTALAASIALAADVPLDTDFEVVPSAADAGAARLLGIGITPAKSEIDLMSEWQRLGLTAGLWRVSNVNEQHHLCTTYPTRWAVPASVWRGVGIARALARMVEKTQRPAQLD